MGFLNNLFTTKELKSALTYLPIIKNDMLDYITKRSSYHSSVAPAFLLPDLNRLFEIVETKMRSDSTNITGKIRIEKIPIKQVIFAILYKRLHGELLCGDNHEIRGILRDSGITYLHAFYYVADELVKLKIITEERKEEMGTEIREGIKSAGYI